jgi:hypothetical protein
MAILPSEVVVAALQFSRSLLGDVPTAETEGQLGNVLAGRIIEVYDAIRKWVGVESLSEDMLRVFGKPKGKSAK